MNSITSEARFRQRVIRYSEKHGVTAASIRHRRSRQAIYEWRAKYDGNWKSLIDKSRRPHSHPNQHTEEEKSLILRHYKYHSDDMIVLWDVIRRFYKKMRMYSLEDGRKQLKLYNKWSNTIPKICLNFLSPNEELAKYLGVM